MPGRSTVTTDLSVSDAIDDFLEEVERGSARDRYGRRFSYGADRELHWSLGGHVSEEFGALSLREVRRRDVEALVYELADAGVGRRRLDAIAKSVRALFDYATERGLVERNPAERIALPDEADAEQPTGGSADQAHTRLSWGGWRRAANSRPTRTLSYRAISLVLQLSTLGFLLLALFLIAESL